MEIVNRQCSKCGKERRTLHELCYRCRLKVAMDEAKTCLFCGSLTAGRSGYCHDCGQETWDEPNQVRRTCPKCAKSFIDEYAQYLCQPCRSGAFRGAKKGKK